jgi:hypothetical protein
MIHRYSIKGVEMNCKQLTAVGFTEGFLVLAPTAACATTGTSTPSAPTSPTASPTRDPVGPTAVALSAHRGGPGAKVKIFVTLPPQVKSPPAKQVAKVPAGAPATGGGGSDAPASSGQG